MSYREFMEQPGWYQSLVVGAYRTKGQIDAVLAENHHIEMEKMRAQAEAQRNSKPY